MSHSTLRNFQPGDVLTAEHMNRLMNAAEAVKGSENPATLKAAALALAASAVASKRKFGRRSLLGLWRKG